MSECQKDQHDQAEERAMEILSHSWYNDALDFHPKS